MSISDNIKYLRNQNNLSQADLGKIAGVTDKAVSTWEKGTKIPRMGALENLSKYFGIPKSEILDGDLAAFYNKKGPDSKEPELTDEQLKFALFGGADVTDAQFEEVKRFAQFVKHRDGTKD